MLDQYDEIVPNDLIILAAVPRDLHPAEVAAVLDLAWYQPDLRFHQGRQHLILVSRTSMNEVVAGHYATYDMVEAGIRKLYGVSRLDRELHCHSPEMFYIE